MIPFDGTPLKVPTIEISELNSLHVIDKSDAKHFPEATRLNSTASDCKFEIVIKGGATYKVNKKY